MIFSMPPALARSAFGRVAKTLVTVLVVSVSLVACSITRDDAPRVIDRDAIPELGSPTTAPVLPEGSAAVLLYFPDVKGEALVPIERSSKSSLDPQAVLQQLINGPTEDERQDFSVTTSIPTGTEVLGVQRDGGLMIINLNEGIDSVEGPGLINAYAQILWTATEIAGVDRVQFRVNGEDRPGASDAGPQDVLDRAAFGGANVPVSGTEPEE